MLATILRWVLILGFVGVLIPLVISFLALSKEQQNKYIVWFIISVVLIGFSITAQAILAGTTP